MDKKLRALLCIDYQNLYHKAREYGHDFQILPYVAFLRTLYGIKYEHVFIFMSADFYKSMHKNVKRYVLKGGSIRLSTRTRAEDGDDPVDKKMAREVLSAIRQNDIDIILVGSSDGVFAKLGTVAWHWNKEFHVYPYAEPSNKYRRHVNSVFPVHSRIDLPVRR